MLLMIRVFDRKITQRRREASERTETNVQTFDNGADGVDSIQSPISAMLREMPVEEVGDL